jgi:hypothetical protein
MLTRDVNYGIHSRPYSYTAVNPGSERLCRAIEDREPGMPSGARVMRPTNHTRSCRSVRSEAAGAGANGSRRPGLLSATSSENTLKIEDVAVEDSPVTEGRSGPVSNIGADFQPTRVLRRSDASAGECLYILLSGRTRRTLANRLRSPRFGSLPIAAPRQFIGGLATVRQ